MFKKIMLLVVLPSLLLAQPAEARRLFWWEMVNPDGMALSPNVYDDDVAPQDVYGPDPYDAPNEQFNQDQYQLYRREMQHRYHRNTYQGPKSEPPYAVPHSSPPYAAPIYPTKPKRKLVNTAIPPKPIVKKLVATATVAPAPQIAPLTTPMLTPPVTAEPKLLVTKKSGAVNCEKGASIVSSFGFEGVSTKSCDGTSLVYNASRGGKPFEINVSPSSGELIAVKKL